jgi:hypothetical protein
VLAGAAAGVLAAAASNRYLAIPQTARMNADPTRQ